MAGPFKRICLQATRSKPALQRSQWQPIRYISSSSARQASSNARQDSTFLDTLAQQPGVKYSTTEDVEDVQKLDVTEMSAMAHRELEQHRELREMVRLAAWEMPLLSSLSKPFEPPRENEVLRWRYTTYMRETHPAARKVVVEFQPERLPNLTQQQHDKLLKLAGPRYNPSTKTIKMSCESFETQAQNKRYLGDTIQNLITESTDPNADSFADLPLDTRHHKPRTVHKFPEGWVMTPERRAELEQKRRRKVLEEGKRIEEDKMVNGLTAIEEARRVSLRQVEQPVMANAKQRVPSGKMGRREMGQQRGANRP